MFTPHNRKENHRAVHARIRRQIRGTAERPRLAFFRSDRHVYVQLIDDEAGKTLVAASTMDKALKGKVPRRANLAAAKAVGAAIAERALAQRIESVVFDRGGFLYHGAVKALADAARARGLKF